MGNLQQEMKAAVFVYSVLFFSIFLKTTTSQLLETCGGPFHCFSCGDDIDFTGCSNNCKNGCYGLPYDIANTSIPQNKSTILFKHPLIEYVEEHKTVLRQGNLSLQNIVDLFEYLRDIFKTHANRCPTCSLEKLERFTKFAHKKISSLKKGKGINKKMKKISTRYMRKTVNELNNLTDNIVAFITPGKSYLDKFLDF